MNLGRYLRGAALPLALLPALACSRTPPPAVSPAAGAVPAVSHLPPVPAVRGPLALKVVYPSQADVVEARDSSFIFGSAGSGDAAVTINGAPVRVWPNGAWIGWIAFPPDSVMRFDIVATTPRDTSKLVWTARRARRRARPTGAVWIDSTSITPRGDLWLPRDENVTVSVRAAPGAALRLRLVPGLDVWVPAADAHPVPLATQPAVVGSLTLTPREDRAVLRIPVSDRVPFQVTETERTLAVTLYGTVGDVNWIRYGSPDPLVRAIAWAQGGDRSVTLTVTLGEPVWGFRTRWDRGDLLLEIRRPPAIDPGSPLRDRLIVVDPGHPPIGATGPTGLREAEANLGIGLALRDMLQAAGARVIMTRVSDSAVELYPRTKLADTANAELLISIHNNALPDGVNPFTNNGTSVFYNHPRSIPLAMAVDRALVARLGVRDLGVGRGDLALVRPTWMPAILSEGLFMMLPDQEAALRSPEGQRLYAEGVFEGIRQFLRDRARAP